MIGLNLNINFLLIIIMGYILYKILNNTYIKNSHENTNILEKFSNPSSYDPYDIKFKKVLNQNINNTCIKKNNSECLPYSINYKPSDNEESELENIKEGVESLGGRNFLYAKQHSQVDNVGITKKKKVDIRPELINPQLGVDPWTQSIININWSQDDKILQNPEKNKNIWDRLT
jgi:hypothetical protein